MQNPAPHEGKELALVLSGDKPIGLVEQNKDPQQYRQVLHTMGLHMVHTNTDGRELVFSLPKNSALVTQYMFLLSPKAAIVIHSKAEHQRLMGRLFGYSEEEIESFIKGDLNCNCNKCVGVGRGK